MRARIATRLIVLLSFLALLAGGCMTVTGDPGGENIGQAEQELGTGGSGGAGGGAVDPWVRPVCSPEITEFNSPFPPLDEVANHVPEDPNNDIGPDQRIIVDTELNEFLISYDQGNHGHLQQMRDRTKMAITNVFALGIYEGDHGCLLMDLPGHFGPEERRRYLELVGEACGWTGVDYQSLKYTPLPFLPPLDVGSGKPITAVVMTHPHEDHAGGIEVIRRLFPNVDIVMSRWAADSLVVFDQPTRPPEGYDQTREGNNSTVLRCRNDYFWFEDTYKFTMNTPVDVAHTPADSYIITPNKVLMAVDFVHPNGRVPFVDNSVSLDSHGNQLFLRFLLGEWEAGNWEVANWGHFNTGHVRDVVRVLEFDQDMARLWAEAINREFLPKFIKSGETSLIAAFTKFYDAVPQYICERLNDKWHNSRFFEGCAEIVHEFSKSYFLRKLNGNEHNIGDPTLTVEELLDISEEMMFDDTPIPPGTRIYHEDEYCKPVSYCDPNEFPFDWCPPWRKKARRGRVRVGRQHLSY